MLDLGAKNYTKAVINPLLVMLHCNLAAAHLKRAPLSDAPLEAFSFAPLEMVDLEPQVGGQRRLAATSDAPHARGRCCRVGT